MELSEFAVLRAADDFDGTLVHCFHGRELVLAHVTRIALDDYFGWPWSLADQKMPSMSERHLVVDRNLEAIASIIQEKFRRANYQMVNRYGSSLKLIEVTNADLQRGIVELTDNVIQVARAASFAAWG